MTRENSFHFACWELHVGPEHVEGVLARLREGNPRVTIQMFGSSRTPNPSALELIAAQTLSAAKSGSTLADRPELDLLLRLAGTRQIGEAFKRAGYKMKGKRLFLVAAAEGSGVGLKRLSAGLAKDRRFVSVAKKKLTNEELLEVERAALLASRL